MTIEKRRIKAFIVGIEKYEHTDIPDLDGPALDAARFAVWLRNSGIPQNDIKLFLSPLPKNESVSSELTMGLNSENASSQNITSALRHVIEKSVSDIFIMFWAGHGCMLSNEQRLMFFPVGSNDIRLYFNLSEFISSISKSEFKNHQNQHFFIDACADFLEPTEIPTQVNIFPANNNKSRNINTTQFTLFSASPGEQSSNRRNIQAGFASNALMQRLQNAKTWPSDPSSLFDDTVSNMQSETEEGGVLQHHPYISKNYPASVTSGHIEHSGFISDSETARVIKNVENAFDGSRSHPALRYDLEIEDGVSHFRRRSQEAFESAGKVPPSNLNGQHILLADGLYVKRDLEVSVLNALSENRMIIPVQGAPGAGKTSMLWGIGAECAQQGWDVLFVQAPWLSNTDVASNAKTAKQLTIAAKLSKNSGNSVVVLIDTADALISQDEGLDSLVDLVESLNAGQVPVILTCRPEEAKRMPTSWKEGLATELLVGLGDFSVTPTSFREFSEFELAVASHAESFKTRTGHSTEFLIHQLANAVSRKKPMSQFCLRPLFLRMLFDLYAPFAVPENLNITMLYEQYWMDRVVNDSRHLGEKYHPEADDISHSVMLLGREMLQLGIPELRFNTIVKSQQYGGLFNEITELQRRGLGEIKDGNFSFFHQTFFEFAAAKSLLKDSGVNAICILLDRIKRDTGNYFLLAVLEQTWLCAWADDETRFRAIKIAERVLGANAKKIPSSIRQVTLRILAQAPIVSDDLWEAFHKSVNNDSFDTFISALKLLPTPSRQSGQQEIELCKVGASRSDNARSESLALLERLIDAEPEKLIKLIGEDFPFIPTDKRQLEHSTVQLIASMLSYEQRTILRIMSQLVKYAIRVQHYGLHELILREALKYQGKHSREFANWCNIQFPNPNPKLQILLAEANAHGIGTDIENGEISQVIAQLWEVLHRIMPTSALEITQQDRNVFSGSLLAIGNPSLQFIIPKVLSTILLNGDPRVHSWIHYGLLVPLLNKASEDILYFIAFQIARGLPATSFNQESVESRWADTFRRSIARPETDPLVLKKISEEVERLINLRGDDAKEFWFKSEYFVDLVVQAAGAGVVTAQSALHDLEISRAKLDPKVISQLSDKLKQTEGTLEQKSRALRILIQFGNISTIKYLVDNISIKSDESARFPELDSFIRKGLISSKAAHRDANWDLYKTSIVNGLSEWPLANFYEDHIRGAKGDPPLALIELLELGLSKRIYDPKLVKDLVGIIFSVRKSKFHEKKESALRRVHVRTLALTAPASSWKKIFDEVFRLPYEKSLLVNAASVLVDQHRPQAALSPDQKLDLLLYVGVETRARSLSRAATKHAAPAWRSGIGETLHSLGVDDLAKLLTSLEKMSVDFAVEIASQLDIRGSGVLRESSENICVDESVDPRIRKVLQNNLKETWKSSTPRTWLDLETAIRNHKSCDLCSP